MCVVSRGKAPGKCCKISTNLFGVFKAKLNTICVLLEVFVGDCNVTK